MQYRLCFILLLVLALIGPAVSDDGVTLVVGREVFLHTSPVLVDGTVYVPFAALEAIGAKCEADDGHKRDGQKVEITPAGGRKFSCPARLVAGELMLPIQEIAPKVGAAAVWDEETGRLSLRARVERVEFDGSKVQISTSFPVTYEVAWWEAKNRLICHLHGVEIPTKASDLPVENSTDVPIRAGMKGEISTIVLDMPCAVRYRVASAPKSSKVMISVSGFRPAPTSPDLVPGGRTAAEDQQSAPPSEPPEPPEPELPPADITKVDCRELGPHRLDVYVATSRPVEYITYMFRDPDRVVLDLYDAVLSEEVRDVAVGRDILQGVRVGQTEPKKARIVMDLARVVGFGVRYDERRSRFIVSLELPKGAGGLLSEKTIVIDPGHGGHDTGAIGCNGWKEKDSNLAMALRLQKLLSAAGAAALMTRRTDVSLDSNKKRDLEKRAEFARRHSADLFLSIHSNSVRAPRSVSGIETYYHGHETSGRALAHCIHSDVIKAAGLPDLGVKSDFVLYRTGLGVLRNASARGLPAALIEVGFINHPYDSAKITNPAFQQKVAQALVKGLKAYVEGNPRPRPSPVERVERTEAPPVRVSEKPVSRPEPETGPEVETPAPPDSDPDKVDTSTATGPHRPGGR